MRKGQRWWQPTRITGILLVDASGLARNQKIGVYAASTLNRTGDWEPTVIAELLRERHPTELLQLGQSYRTTDLEVTLVPALIIYPFRLTFV